MHFCSLIIQTPYACTRLAFLDCHTLVVVIICFFSIWTVLGMCGFHSLLVLQNITTNEDVSRFMADPLVEDGKTSRQRQERNGWEMFRPLRNLRLISPWEGDTFLSHSFPVFVWRFWNKFFSSFGRWQEKRRSLSARKWKEKNEFEKLEMPWLNPKYSKTCLKRPPHFARKSGRYRQVVS